MIICNTRWTKRCVVWNSNDAGAAPQVSRSILTDFSLATFYPVMRSCLLAFLVVSSVSIAKADEHGHSASESPAKAAAPTVFLDKSPRIVAYQLKRLNNTRLLMVERKTSDPKFVPVYSAILSRNGMPAEFRIEAAEALSKLNNVDIVTVLLDGLSAVDDDDREAMRTKRELAGLLLRRDPSVFDARADVLVEATKSSDAFVRSVAFAGLAVAGRNERVAQQADRDAEATNAWLGSISLIPSSELRSSYRDRVAAQLGASSKQTVNAAINALGFIPAGRAATFDAVAPLAADKATRSTAIKTLLKIADADRDGKASETLLRELVDYAEKLPAAKRTSADFTDAMQLANLLMAGVPVDVARPLRERLREISVRLVRIKTVEEEMRYDVEYFAVEAGRPVQIVLENEDLMPHNLVISMPGSLKEVARLGLAVGPTGGSSGLQYVPDSDLVLHATDMIPAHAKARLTFTAPTQPGEYPFVCTFPQHWYRMYGVMVVVEDLDAYLQNPVRPANPIGSNRVFVQSWTVDDFKGEMENGLVGRSPEIGAKIFTESSCAGCHKIAGEGGMIGPELTDVMDRWKGDSMGVLREILEPSHKIDAKYAMQRILTVDGRTISGVLVKEDDDNVTLLASAEAKEPTVVAQDDIEAMVPSSVSMMPKALMDQYTKDEIFELMSYLQSVGPKAGL